MYIHGVIAGSRVIVPDQGIDLLCLNVIQAGNSLLNLPLV